MMVELYLMRGEMGDKDEIDVENTSGYDITEV